MLLYFIILQGAKTLDEVQPQLPYLLYIVWFDFRVIFRKSSDDELFGYHNEMEELKAIDWMQISCNDSVSFMIVGDYICVEE